MLHLKCSNWMTCLKNIMKLICKCNMFWGSCTIWDFTPKTSCLAIKKSNYILSALTKSLYVLTALECIVEWFYESLVSKKGWLHKYYINTLYDILPETSLPYLKMVNYIFFFLYSNHCMYELHFNACFNQLIDRTKMSITLLTHKQIWDI